MRGCIDPKSITVSSLPFPVLHGSAPKKNNKFTLIYTATFGNQPSLNAQSCNTRPLYSTFTFENVRSQFFLTPKTWKTCPQKLLVIGPKLFIFVLARLFKQPRNRKLVPPKAPQCRTVYLEWGNHATLPLPFCNVGVCGTRAAHAPHTTTAHIFFPFVSFVPRSSRSEVVCRVINIMILDHF